MNFNDVMTQVARFTNISAAISYLERKQGRWMVLGDEGEYWVTSRRYAQWLVKNGYAILGA